MPKIVCENCSYVLNLSEIPNFNEFESLPAAKVDDFIKEVLEKMKIAPDVQNQLAIVSDLWADRTQSFWRCPHCGSLILSGSDGKVETYVKL